MGEKKLEPFITTQELMDLLGVSKDTIERFRNKQDLPFYKIGKKVRFRFSDVEKWMRSRKVNG